MRHPHSHIGVFALVVLASIGGAPTAALAGLCCLPNEAGAGHVCVFHAAAVDATAAPDATPPPACPMHRAASSADESAAPPDCCCLRMSGCAAAPSTLAFASSGFLIPNITIARPSFFPASTFTTTPAWSQMARPPLFPPPRASRS